MFQLCVITNKQRTMKRDKIIYWAVTGLFSLMLIGGAMTYIFSHETAVNMFTALGYPTYIIYPMATTKLLGVTAILTNKSEKLKQWAYFGFIINLFLATFSHIAVGDGGAGGAIMAFILLIVSMIFDARIKKHQA